MRQELCLCLFLAILCAVSGDVFGATWDGTWDTNQGKMQLEQSGNRVTGTYGSSGKVEGTVNGSVLKGTYQWTSKTGVFELTMSADGSSFAGEWSRSGANGKWSGKRVGAPVNGGSSSSDLDDPQGSDEPAPNQLTRVLPLRDGLTQYTIWSVDQDGNGDSSAQVLNMGPHTYCALTYVMSGGFNSACAVKVRGNDWILAARDPKSPDPWTGESQGCSAICFDQ